MSELGIVRLLARYLAQLSAKQVHCEQTNDFELVQKTIEQLGKPYVTPQMDVRQNDFTPTNCFWLIFYTSDAPIAIGGVRLDDLSGHDPRLFLERTFARYYEGGLTKVAEPLSSALRGRVCYMGDLFVHPGHRGKLELVQCAVKICHLLVNLKWNPDCTYAFLRRKDADRGAASRYGFTRTVPFSKEFAQAVLPRSNDEVCAMLPRSDFEYWIRAEQSS